MTYGTVDPEFEVVGERIEAGRRRLGGWGVQRSALAARVSVEIEHDGVADEGAVDKDPRARLGIARIKAQLDTLAAQFAHHLEAAAAELDRAVGADPSRRAEGEDVTEIGGAGDRTRVTVGELSEEMLLRCASGRRVDAPMIVAGRRRPLTSVAEDWPRSQ